MNLNFEDNELDRLFKNKAKDEGGEPEFDEFAWEDMERRLDKRKRRIAFYYLSAAALFFVVLGMGWFFIQNNYEINKTSEKIYALKKQSKKPDLDRQISKSEAKNNLENDNHKPDRKDIINTNSLAKSNHISIDNDLFTKIKKAGNATSTEGKVANLTSNDVLQNNDDSFVTSRVGEV